MNINTTKFDCIILAGGEGKRMDGEDKGFVLYKNKSLIESVIEKIKPQVDNIVISANRNIERYKKFGYPVVTDVDSISNQKNDKNIYQGPLAGIAAALPLCTNEWVFIIACDMPLISDTIVSLLQNSLDTNNLKTDNSNNQKTIAIAEVNKKFQLAMLLNKNLLPSIQLSLKNDQLKLMQWVKSNTIKPVSFSTENEFRNFNYSKDLM
jgi:molybdopterin-guanine dinucleotide biosynthesis protein A